MEKSEKIGNLAKALIEFNKKVDSINKDANNPFYRSKYATLANVIEGTREKLNECGLTLNQFPDHDNNLVSLLIHAESGEYISSVYPIHPMPEYVKEKDQSGNITWRGEYYFSPQAIGSAISYARRYAQCAILNLAIEDDDGNIASGKDVKAAVQPVKKVEAVNSTAANAGEKKVAIQVGAKKNVIIANKDFENENKDAVKDTGAPIEQAPVVVPEVKKEEVKPTPVEEPMEEPKKKEPKKFVIGGGAKKVAPVEEKKEEHKAEEKIEFKPEETKETPIVDITAPKDEFIFDKEDREKVIEKIKTYTDSKVLMTDAPGILTEFKSTKPSSESYNAVRDFTNAYYKDLLAKEKEKEGQA